jgi:hypothetical protein
LSLPGMRTRLALVPLLAQSAFAASAVADEPYIRCIDNANAVADEPYIRCIDNANAALFDCYRVRVIMGARLRPARQLTRMGGIR